ncbi:MAG: hypothetical protein IT448_07325 [Phycisphaerales bacterium]|nr:hypothetical protein [Phycisphaerales bacterium]
MRPGLFFLIAALPGFWNSPAPSQTVTTDSPAAASQSLTPPATQPATTQPQTLAQMKADELADLHKQIDSLPEIGPYARADLLSLQLHNGHITARSGISPTQHNAQLRISDDEPGLWQAMVRQKAGLAGNNGLFLIQRYDFSSPDDIFTVAVVSAYPQQTTITGNWIKPDQQVQMDLSDRRAIIDENGLITPGAVQLSVNSYRDDGSTGIRINIAAESFSDLHIAHLHQVNTYLRPVLRQLSQEQLLTIDPPLAWQVLGDNQPIDDNTTRQVGVLVGQLNSAVFADRRSAAEQLRRMNEQAALVLLKMDCAHLSPEQQSTIDQILIPYHQVSAQQAHALTSDPEFLIDVLLSPQPLLRQRALNQLRHICNPAIAFDPDAPLPIRLQQADDLRRALVR